MSDFDYVDFKTRATTMTDEEFYRSYDRIFALKGMRDYTLTNLDQIRAWIVGDVLEIGCASGDLLVAIGDGHRRCGVDISTYALTEARRKLPGVELLQADVERGLPLVAKDWDTILAGFVFEHLREPRKAVEEIHRLCRGHAIILIPLQGEDQRWRPTNLHLHFWPTTESFEAFWGGRAVDAITARDGTLGILRFDCRRT